MGLVAFINKLARPAPEWAVNYYEKRGKHFQKRADKIQRWAFSPGMKALLERVNDLLPEVITKALWKEVDKAHRRFGPESAENHIKEVLKKLKEFTIDITF